jgi:hypothetical protein
LFYLPPPYSSLFSSSDPGLVIYYTIINSISGEAMKPWLGGESQPKGIVGVGTYKRKNMEEEEENTPATV